MANIALERINTQEKISQLAFYDTLTGLPNRASLSLHLENVMISLDDFGTGYSSLVLTKFSCKW